ncbi:hypothetical protein, partial [Edwardsiella tarda]|uniref:hypothetical protein n=1 Tax=Edwardsiella tarda TaxID=636 RepID=UPI001967A51A
SHPFTHLPSHRLLARRNDIFLSICDTIEEINMYFSTDAHNRDAGKNNRKHNKYTFLNELL